jgi:hypothetical protein
VPPIEPLTPPRPPLYRRPIAITLGIVAAALGALAAQYEGQPEPATSTECVRDCAPAPEAEPPPATLPEPEPTTEPLPGAGEV